MQERALNILVGALTGQAGSAVTKEALSTAAEKMRDLMIEDSEKFAGVVDVNGKSLFSNISGDSAGVNGDGKKIAGTRAELDLLCGPANERCATQTDASHRPILGSDGIPKLALTDAGEVVFTGGLDAITGEPRMTYPEFLETADGQQMLSAPFGGLQGGPRTWLFGVSYEKGSWVDQLLEAFAGPHDLIGGKLPGLYDEQGNARRGLTDAEIKAYTGAGWPCCLRRRWPRHEFSHRRNGMQSPSFWMRRNEAHCSLLVGSAAVRMFPSAGLPSYTQPELFLRSPLGQGRDDATEPSR